VPSLDLDVREDGGLDVVALIAAAGLPSGDQRGAFALSDVNVPEDLLVLVLVNLVHCDFTAVRVQLVAAPCCRVPDVAHVIVIPGGLG
jgi:hypothetical protein